MQTNNADTNHRAATLPRHANTPQRRQNGRGSHLKTVQCPDVLIREQKALLAVLLPLWRDHFARGTAGLSSHTVGLRSKAKRLHVEALVAAGFDPSNAWESADQCDDLARMDAGHVLYLQEMGVAA